MRRYACAGMALSVLFLVGGCENIEMTMPIEKLPGVHLFVSTSGNDAWSGKLAEPNAAKTDGPFATLRRARDEIRALKIQNPKSKIQNGVTVLVRGGMYSIAETMKLGAEDSGSPEAPIVYRAYKDEKPILIGGRPITGFVPYKDKVLKADVASQGFKDIYFRQLFFDGKRQFLARYPNHDPGNPYGGGFAYVDGEPIPMYKNIDGEPQNRLHYKPQDFHNWAHPEEGEVFVFPRYNWWNNICPIKSVDREKRIYHLTQNASYPIRPTDRYYVRNIFEELDSPGEWYLDRRTWTLYFWPPSPLEGKAVYAPTTRTILEIGPGVANLTIRGFTIECCEGTAVTLKDTKDCLIAANTIRNVGDYGGSGVSVNGGSGNGVVGNDIYEVGRDGISIGGGDRITLTPSNNYAENNYIHHIGVFYKQGVGISLHGCGNRASRNLIHDGPRWGIGFGGNNLVIEYNEIRHVNLETADTGAVYTGGRDWISSRGTVIRYNFFHDIIGFGSENGKWRSPHYCWGVYLDDNTGGVDVIGNILVRTIRGLVHLHNGRDNHIENNILIDGEMQQVEYNGWTGASRAWTDHLPTMIKGYESVINQPAWQKMRNMHIHPTKAVLPDGKIMTGNVFLRNIMYYHNPKSKLFQFRTVPFDHYESDYNLIWHFGQPLLTGETRIKDVEGPNLAPNPGFEEGKPGDVPQGWQWQVRPNDSKAAIDAEVRFAGKQSLRIDGRGTASNGKQTLCPNFVSADLPAKLGQTYRLTARLRAAQPGTKFAMMPQSYIANVYFWAKDLSLALDTEWKEYELVFKFPAPGDPGYNEQMKTMRIRLDIRQEAGTVWVDDVTLHEAVAMDEWEAWKAMGFDRHSLIADPLFVNPEKDDYRLQPNSPAFKLGFKPIPIDKIGPYKDPLRASWPIVEAEGAREKPAVLRTEKP